MARSLTAVPTHDQSADRGPDEATPAAPVTDVRESAVAPHEEGADEAPARPRGEKRDRILDAAIVVFARKGFHGARVSDIAKEAEIAYGLVYHYFKNKDQILSTIFAERWTGFLEAVEAIGRSPGTMQNQLVSIATLILNAYRLRPDFVKVFVLEMQRSSRFAEPAQQQAVARLFDIFERTLRAGQERGELRSDMDPRVGGALFLGAIELVITSLVLGVAEMPEDDAGQRAYYLEVAHQVVDLFLHGTAGPPVRS